MNKKLLCTLLVSTFVVYGCAVSKKDKLASLDKLPIKIQKDAPITSARKKAFDNYESFINSAPKDMLRVEALRRLADLELEKSEERFQQQLAKMERGEDGAVKKEAKIKEQSYKKAIGLYEDAAKSSVGESDDPQIFYQLSKTLPYIYSYMIEKNSIYSGKKNTR